MMKYWDFEKPIIDLENTIAELRKFATEKAVDLSGEIKNLQKKLNHLQKEVYAHLTPWQKIQIARHPNRPTVQDYIQLLAKDFIPLCGDRLFGDDKAILGGFAKIDDHKVVLLGHLKGKETKEHIERNFGCAHPEGYRKAMRLMQLAERYSLPIVCLIDTPGAYPGVGAEERGQAQAIAENIRDMFALKVPIIVVIIGEGGSGGALGIGVGDRVLVMQYAYYSVISPEGCAAILWRDASKAPQAAEALRITSDELLKLKLIDDVVPEPQGGAHRNYQKAAKFLKQAIVKNLNDIVAISDDELTAMRYKKFRKMGAFNRDRSR